MHTEKEKCHASTNIRFLATLRDDQRPPLLGLALSLRSAPNVLTLWKIREN